MYFIIKNMTFSCTNYCVTIMVKSFTDNIAVIDKTG